VRFYLPNHARYDYLLKLPEEKDIAKALKTALEELHREVKNAEIFYQHIHWLQERFPKAECEDMTGLCKLASLAEVREQEYSLNPGRYVGVVIEGDGKTEEEFIADLLKLNGALETLNGNAAKLGKIIAMNVAELVEMDAMNSIG